MRLGLFGGSFDPIHYGHLLLAECCWEQARLDQVLFVPAAIAPHKQGCLAAPPEDRVAMVELAIAGHSAFRVSRHEIDRGGVNYTVDTLETFHSRWPDAELFFLLGADMFHDLPNWRRASRVCQLATPLVVSRAGEDPIRLETLDGIATSERLESIAQEQVRMPPVCISSSEIRQRVSRGQSIRYRTPPEVVEYIRRRRLYEDAE